MTIGCHSSLLTVAEGSLDLFDGLDPSSAEKSSHSWPLSTPYEINVTKNEINMKYRHNSSRPPISWCRSDGWWVLCCGAQHLAEGIQEMVPGLCGGCCFYLWRAVSLLCMRDGAGSEPHTSPAHCPRRHPQTRCSHWQNWGTTWPDTHGDDCNAAQGTVHQKCFSHCGAWLRFVYVTSCSADFFVSGRWCEAELFCWALTCLMHPNKWRILVWRFAATLR